MTVTQLNPSAPVVLLMQEEPIHLKPYLNEIRMCISVLFAFQRKLIRDETFLKETREWLSRLVAVLLRLANFHDHLFILSHILRCPAGIQTWASKFIQIPLEINLQESPFVNYQINHTITILSAILFPVRYREKFLEDVSLYFILIIEILLTTTVIRYRKLKKMLAKKLYGLLSIQMVRKMKKHLVHL